MTTTIIVAIVAVVVATYCSSCYLQVTVDNKIPKDAEVVGTARQSRSILDEALKTAETKKEKLYWK